MGKAIARVSGGAGTTVVAVSSLTGGDASALASTDPKFRARYSDDNGSPHTSIWFIPVLASAVYPQTLAVYVDQGDGLGWGWWQNITITASGQVCYLDGDAWVPTATNETWTIACVTGFVAGDTTRGLTLPGGAVSCTPFTVTAVGACLATDITNAQFIPDGTGHTIRYGRDAANTLWWIYNELDWTQPSRVSDINYWFSFVTVQKGAIISGVWTPAPDKEGDNQDPTGSYLGRWHTDSGAIQGGASIPGSTVQLIGDAPPDWTYPPNLLDDGVTANPYRTFRFRLYAVSRRGTDINGGTGVMTLQTCWAGGADHFDLTPDPHPQTFDASTINPNTLGTNIGKDGSGRPVVKITGPIYNDVAGLNLRLSSDYAVVTVGGNPTLTQAAVNLVNAYGFGSEFTTSGGAFIVNAIGVNKLVAGNALFTGTATFAYSGGGSVVIGAGGLTLSNSNTSPVNTVTIASGGVTIANTTSGGSAQITSAGMAIYAGSSTTANLVQVTSGGVTIIGPTGSGSSVTVGSGGVTIANAALSVINGSTTINLDKTNYFQIVQNISGVNYTVSISPSGLAIFNSSTSARTAVGNGVASITDASGNGWGFSTSQGILVGSGGATALTLLPTSVQINSTQVLSTRVATTPVTLADVITVLQHHGLSN